MPACFLGQPVLFSEPRFISSLHSVVLGLCVTRHDICCVTNGVGQGLTNITAVDKICQLLLIQFILWLINIANGQFLLQIWLKISKLLITVLNSNAKK